MEAVTSLQVLPTPRACTPHLIEAHDQGQYLFTPMMELDNEEKPQYARYESADPSARQESQDMVPPPVDRPQLGYSRPIAASSRPAPQKPAVPCPSMYHQRQQQLQLQQQQQQRNQYQHMVERRAPEQQAWRPRSATEWRSQEFMQSSDRSSHNVYGMVPAVPDSRSASIRNLHQSMHQRPSARYQGYYPPPDRRYQSSVRMDAGAASIYGQRGERITPSSSSQYRHEQRIPTQSTRQPINTHVHHPASSAVSANQPPPTSKVTKQPELISQAEEDPEETDIQSKRTISSTSSVTSSSTSSPRLKASDPARLFECNAASPPAKRIKTYLKPQSGNMALLCSAIFSLGPLKDNPRGCSCPKSKCLALYCDCFKAGRRCSPITCACLNCKNTVQESGASGARTKAIQALLARNPRAFIAPNEMLEKKVLAPGENSCNCVRSRCIKKYCVCYQKGKQCDPLVCACVGCLNSGDGGDGDGDGDDDNNNNNSGDDSV